GRGVVTTSTYEARKLGVFSAMGMMKSAALAPEAFLLPVDFDEYRKFSRAFKAAVREIAPVIEDRGIDEIYVDLSELAGVHEDGGRCVGLALKAAVQERTGLSCSIGITPNKLLSKLASELDKPDGLTLLGMADVATRLWPLPARKVNGIGPKAAAKLAEHGLHSIGDIAAAEREVLIEHFGKSYGAWLHEAAHGRDERAVVTEQEVKSISRETTFERDLHAVRDRGELGAILTRLCEQLAGDLAKKGYAAKTLGIKLRFDDFRIATRDVTLPAHATLAADIRRNAGLCLKRVDLSRRLRLLGVRAANLATLNDLVAGNVGGAASPATAVIAREPAPRELPLFDMTAPPA
ncbi:MAG: DNA polymerase IV, partial [Pseudomonadota bacterium]|nr:DNA polymerase IV [Pseudomonadota bacterium]